MLVVLSFVILMELTNSTFPSVAKFPNVDYAPDIRCPVFIVHGTQDEVVPFWHGEELFLALQQPWRAKPFWVDGAGVSQFAMTLS